MKDKKLFLRVMVKLMSLAALGFVFYMLFAGLFDDGNNLDAIYIDISEVDQDEVRYFDVSSKKILVLHRSKTMLKKISGRDEELLSSSRDKLAENMHPLYRSINEKYFIALAYDPVFGCAVERIDDYFKSVCVDIKYDLAGRVYKNKRSARNLIVPEYKFIKPNLLVIQSN